MKKVLIIALVLIPSVSFCQAKKDTSKLISFNQNEIKRIQENLTKTVQTIHKMDIKALSRDSIDNLIGAVYNFILQRETETYHPKAAAKEGGKEN